MAKISANKGDWSEIYALFYLLTYGKIHAADSHLNSIPDVFFPVLKIFREETPTEKVEYHLPSTINAYNEYMNKLNSYVSEDGVKDNTISIYINDKYICDISRREILHELHDLLDGIKKGGDRAFSLEKTEAFMAKLHCYKVKAPSDDKTDIRMQLQDIHTGYAPVCGFSIKSRLGSPSTLLNASKKTNFIYRLDNAPDKLDIYAINNLNKSKSKLKDRINAITNNGIQLKYVGLYGKNFHKNLTMIDSNMPEIVGYILRESYITGETSCRKLLARIEQKDPFGYGIDGIYTYKFKKFLCSSALGMVPGIKWNGYDEANGGYIIVKEDGGVVAYYLYNRNNFEDYLLDNTSFERASSTRHDYCTIYEGASTDEIEEPGHLYIRLNLQIRFH